MFFCKVYLASNRTQRTYIEKNRNNTSYYYNISSIKVIYFLWFAKHTIFFALFLCSLSYNILLYCKSYQDNNSKRHKRPWFDSNENASKWLINNIIAVSRAVCKDGFWRLPDTNIHLKFQFLNPMSEQ